MHVYVGIPSARCNLQIPIRFFLWSIWMKIPSLDCPLLAVHFSNEQHLPIKDITELLF